MKLFLALISFALLAGCAAVQKAYDYEHLPLNRWTDSKTGDHYQVQDDPENDQMLFAASAGEAMRDGLTWGVTARPHGEYQAAAANYLSEAKNGTCTINEFRNLMTRMYEVRYTCS